MEKKLICINCPMGCRMKVVVKNDKVENVAGNSCIKGVEYANKEAIYPVRVVTSLMRASNRKKPFSVKTTAPIPKQLIYKCVKIIFNTRPNAPLFCGDIVIKNICDTGIDIVVTQDLL